MKARKGTRHWDYGEGYDPTIEKKAIDPERVFDLEREKNAFEAAVAPHLETVYHSFGEGTSDALGVAWNLRDPNVAADILARNNRLRGTVETTWQKVQEAIIDGEAEGEGIDKIAKRIGGVFTQAKGYRARMIARTETIGASNAASLQAADASGVVGKKTWLAASDHRTRSTHVSADGQTVDVKKPFSVGASKMQHPGDPAGGASEVVNCRCSMVFVRDVDAEVPAEEDTFLEDETLDERATRVEAAVKAAKRDGLETHKAWKPEHAPEGFYRRERLLQQEDIIEDFMRKAANVPDEGRAVFSGGLGGAGKGTVLRSDLVDFDPSDFLTIDADAIKEAMAARGMIPKVAGFEDLSPMEMSALVHEESSHIAARLAARAQATRKNMIYDVTMSSETSVRSRLALLKKAGYDDVEMVFVDIDVETSVTRALARWEEGLDAYRRGEGFGGRYVPPDIIRAQADEVWGSVNRKAFEAVKDQADRWTLVNNVGEAPFIAARGTRAVVEEVVEGILTGVTRTGVPLADELPTGLTRVEREEWFAAKWGKVQKRTYGDLVKDPTTGLTTREVLWTEVDRAISWKGMDGLDAHEALIRRFDRLFSNRPDVADAIPRVGTAEGLGVRMGGSTMGQASRRDYLVVKAKAIGTMEDATALANRTYSQGWWSSPDPFAIANHEFGHHVHYLLEEKVTKTFGLDNRAGVRDFIKPILKEVSGLKGNVSPSSGAGLAWIRENLSKYATTNPYETVAEAWAEYTTLGEAARPFAKALGEALEAALDAAQ